MNVITLIISKSNLLTILRNRFVVVELAGGLGNQVFLLEMARYLSHSGNRRIILDISNMDSEQFKGKSTLEDFLLPPDILILKYGGLLQKINNYLKRYFKYINRINKKWILVLDEVSMNLNKCGVDKLTFDNNSKFIIVFGFYQNFEYWNVKQTYELKNPSHAYQGLVKSMVETSPVILHYRTGAIGTVWEYQWGVLSTDFFYSALSTSSGSFLTESKEIWIFSDSVNDVKELFRNSLLNKQFNLIFINDSNMSPAELMMLFSKSHFLICSNSTFSLAAAKIGSVANVIVPASLSKYSRVNISMPEEWIKIKSTWLEN